MPSTHYVLGIDANGEPGVRLNGPSEEFARALADQMVAREVPRHDGRQLARAVVYDAATGLATYTAARA